MELGLKGRRAVIAASSAGLGFATARALIDEGVRVAICGRNGERLERAAADLGDRATAIVADVSTPGGATAFVEQGRTALGGLDILVANSGGPPPGTFASTSLDAYTAALNLNLLSVVAMCKSAVPPMQERKWGRVVAITSIAVRQPIPTLILSNTARAGVTGFLKTLALEVAGDGVTVNSLLPAYHATDRVRGLHGDDLDRLGRQLPVGKVGLPSDFAAFVTFLCSDRARFVTGSAIPVDGGAHSGLL